jgi:hypothetical protein
VAPVTHKRARRLWVIAVVAALHAGVCWVLLKTALPLKVRTATSSLELTYLTLDRPESSARRPTPTLPARPLVRQSVPIPPLRQPGPLDQPSAAAPAEEDNAIHAPIDWANELNRTARESVSGASTPRPREFGAPHVASTPPSKRAEFGWSHSRTHRLETAAGSTDVHWGDHCVIAFTPLPFPVCKLGKKDANGDLFKHMRDPPQPDDSKDPP